MVQELNAGFQRFSRKCYRFCHLTAIRRLALFMTVLTAMHWWCSSDRIWGRSHWTFLCKILLQCRCTILCMSDTNAILTPHIVGLTVSQQAQHNSARQKRLKNWDYSVSGWFSHHRIAIVLLNQIRMYARFSDSEMQWFVFSYSS